MLSCSPYERFRRRHITRRSAYQNILLIIPGANILIVQVTVDGNEKLTPCSPGDAGAMEMNWTQVETDELLEPPLQVKDFVKAIKGARPTVSASDLNRNAEWTEDFGSEGA